MSDPDMDPADIRVCGYAPDSASFLTKVGSYLPAARWVSGPRLVEDKIRSGDSGDIGLELCLFVEKDTRPIVFAQVVDGHLEVADETQFGGPDLPRLTLQRWMDVQPLDDQFGVHPVHNCPEILAPALFPGGSEKLFAVIDAAAIADLPERLEASGATHRSLFIGKTTEELADVAPYLVELPADSSIMRGLFTDTGEGMPWHFYAADAAILLQSDQGFDGLLAHLRKFTKLRDADDSWLFMRFWDQAFRHYFAEYPTGPFPRGFFDKITAAVVRLDNHGWVKATAEPSAVYPSQDFLPRFRYHTRVFLRRRFLWRVIDYLEGTHGVRLPFGQIATYYRMSRDEGYKSERALVKFIEALFLLQSSGRTMAVLEGHPALADASTLSNTARAGAYLSATQEILELRN